MTTRQRIQQIRCPRCGHSFPNESDFSAWVRVQPDLDSTRDGIVIFDCDVIIHRYKFDHNRAWQAIMLVETKCFNAPPTIAQRDTLNMFGQFLRNDKTTPAKRSKIQVPNRPTGAYSTARERMVTCKAFGVHLLTFENTSPDNGTMTWDRKAITRDQLVKLFRFELHPETLRVLDGRKHHRKGRWLFD